MREAIKETEVAETAPKLRAVSPRSSIVKRSAHLDSQRLTRQQKKQNWKHDGKYHCGEKIAKLTLIHFELIFAN